MTAHPTSASATASLFGQQGKLVSLSITAEPRLLEDLLEALAGLDFPVNPQLYHRPAQVRVEFPAYSAQVEQVRDALRGNGFDPASLQVSAIWAGAAAG